MFILKENFDSFIFIIILALFHYFVEDKSIDVQEFLMLLIGSYALIKYNCCQWIDQQICNRAILAATNERVDFINQKIMEDFKSDSCEIYLSADSVQDPSQTSIYPTEFLNSLTPSGLPPHSLFLKKYSPIILIRNLNPKEGLLNGTKLAVINLGRRIIEAKIMTGKHSGKRVLATNYLNTIRFRSSLSTST